jgi:hypothetical protein
VPQACDHFTQSCHVWLHALLLQVDLADSCVLTLSGSWHGQRGWAGWGVSGSSSSSVRDLVDAAIDRVRWWAEQCDRMQGKQSRILLGLQRRSFLKTLRGSIALRYTGLVQCVCHSVILCYALPRHNMPCRAMLCLIMQSHTADDMSCHAVLCPVT